MTTASAPETVRARRLAQVDALVTRAGDRSSLRERLHRVHSRCHVVDDASWAGYVADLDRGLDELHVELAAATQAQAQEPALDDVLHARAAAIELRGWRLTVDAADGGDRLRALLAEAQEALARYREELATGSVPRREDLDRALRELREAAPS